MIDLRDISKTYQLGEYQQTVLKDVTLHINDGEMVAIMGASGSGKSTLMNILGLLDQPTTGKYYLRGREISELTDDERAAIRNRSIGFVFQSFFLLSRMDAVDNVTLPLQYREMPSEEMRTKAQAVLTKVGMADRMDHRPNQLSGGQQQRVAIARALVIDPDMLLADEPTGALDTRIGQEIMDLFIRLNQEEKSTVIIVTHDPKVAAQCQRIIRIVDGNVVDS